MAPVSKLLPVHRLLNKQNQRNSHAAFSHRWRIVSILYVFIICFFLYFDNHFRKENVTKHVQIWKKKWLEKMWSVAAGDEHHKKAMNWENSKRKFWENKIIVYTPSTLLVSAYCPPPSPAPTKTYHMKLAVSHKLWLSRWVFIRMNYHLNILILPLISSTCLHFA